VPARPLHRALFWSARHRQDAFGAALQPGGHDPSAGPLERRFSHQKPIDTVLYTPEIVNSPARIEADIHRARETLSNIATRTIRTEARATLEGLRVRDEDWRQARRKDDPEYRSSHLPPFEPTYFSTFEDYEARTRAIPDPTTLIVIDEADRLRMTSLEQLRSIFDASGLDMVLIGMPGIEKRIARYPQFYSRIGFVHEFRPLGPMEAQHLLEQHWSTLGMSSLARTPSPEVVRAIIRVSAATSACSGGC